MGTASENHRRYAEECVVMAQRSQDDTDKAFWLTLAQSWVRLAEHVARGPSHPLGDDGNATDVPRDPAECDEL